MFRFCTLTLEKSSYQTIRLGKNIGLFINVNEKSNEIWQQLVPGVLLNCSPSMTSQIFIILLSFDRSLFVFGQFEDVAAVITVAWKYPKSNKP